MRHHSHLLLVWSIECGLGHMGTVRGQVLRLAESGSRLAQQRDGGWRSCRVDGQSHGTGNRSQRRLHEWVVIGVGGSLHSRVDFRITANLFSLFLQDSVLCGEHVLGVACVKRPWDALGRSAGFRHGVED